MKKYVLLHNIFDFAEISIILVIGMICCSWSCSSSRKSISSTKMGRISGEIICQTYGETKSSGYQKIRCKAWIKIKKCIDSSLIVYDTAFQPVKIETDSSGRFSTDIAPGSYEAFIEAGEMSTPRGGGKYQLENIDGFYGNIRMIFIRVAPDSISYIQVALTPKSTDFELPDAPIIKWGGEIEPISQKQ